MVPLNFGNPQQERSRDGEKDGLKPRERDREGKRDSQKV